MKGNGRLETVIEIIEPTWAVRGCSLWLAAVAQSSSKADLASAVPVPTCALYHCLRNYTSRNSALHTRRPNCLLLNTRE